MRQDSHEPSATSQQPATAEKPRRGRRTAPVGAGAGVAIDRGLQLHLVLHAQLGGATEKLVLMILLDYYGQNARCCPSHATIATCANLTRRSVIRTIQRLAETGVIRVVGRVDEAGDQTSNEYHFNWDRLEALQPSAEEQPAPSGGDTESPPPPNHKPNHGSDTASPPSDRETPPVVTVGHQGGDTVSHEPPIEPPSLNRMSAQNDSVRPCAHRDPAPTQCAHAAKTPDGPERDQEPDGRMGASQPARHRTPADPEPPHPARSKLARLREDLRGVDFTAPPPGMTPVLALERLGVEPPAARALAGTYEPTRIIRACTRVRDWLLDPKHKPIQNPAGLVTAILQDRSHENEITPGGRLARKFKQLRQQRFASVVKSPARPEEARC